MEKVLAYGLSGEKANILKKNAKDFGIDVGILSDENLDEKVGDLFQISSSSESNGEGEFLIFSDFDREKLRNFLIAMKKDGVVVDHKCVLTKTNSEWTLRYLMDHIKDEHRVVNKFKTLGEYVKVAQNKFKENNDPNLKVLIDEAYKLGKMEIDEKRLDKVMADLKEALNI